MTGFEFDSKPTQTANRSAPVTDCRTCGGDRFVTVRLRKAHNPKSTEMYEEVAPCPDCNPIEVTYYVEGRRFTSMDAQAARKAMAE